MSVTLLSALFCLSASAEVYTYIDKEGNRVFTDQPPRGNAQKLQLAPINSQPGSPNGVRMPPPLYAPATPELPPGPPAYQLLRIIVPEPDATVRANDGALIVSATSDPALLPGHLYRLLLDGKPVGEPGRSPVFPLNNIDRGTHQLSVEIIDTLGRTIEQTPSQPFHMFRVSLAEAADLETTHPLAAANR
ncbi:penicillin-binding protein [Pseudomonas sp. T]|nr:penicillin-binding protein [Pseudomonas sp. T]